MIEISQYSGKRESKVFKNLYHIIKDFYNLVKKILVK